MESWQNGKQELFEELIKTYDRIGVKLATELDHGNSVLINRDILKDLRNKATRFDGLEDEVSTLARQKCDLVVAREENTEEINRLVEDNERLLEELEGHKNKASRLDELEKSNQLLYTELKQLVQRARDIGNVSEATTSRSNPTSSARRIEYDESKPVTREAYQYLVTKYNTVYENWADIKVARKQLVKALCDEKEKTKQYKKYCDDLEKVMAKRREKIQCQDEEIETLRGRMRELDGNYGIIEEAQMKPVNVVTQEQRAQNLDQAGRDLNSVTFGPINAGQVVNVPGVVRSLKSPALDGIVVASCQRSSIFLNPVLPECGDHVTDPAASGSKRIGEGVRSPRRLNQHQDGRALSACLPALLPGGKSVCEGNVADIEFQTTQHYQSSSTDEETDMTCARIIGYQTVKVEASADAPPSPDAPMVISSRSVKRRKGCTNTTESKNHSKVKVETISSSPLGLAELYALNDSIDLDEIGEKQVTPRKGRQSGNPTMEATSQHANWVRMDRNQSQKYSCARNMVVSGPLSQDAPTPRTGVGRTGSALQPLSSNREILPRTSEDRGSKRRRIATDKAVEDLVEDGQKIQLLEKTPLKRLPPPPHFANRLEELLAKPSSPKSILSPTPSTFQSNPESSKLGLPVIRNQANAVPLSDVSSFTDADNALCSRLMLGNQCKKQSKPSPQSTNGEAVHFQNEPLRSRSLHGLTLQDFKVNPKYNQGYKYAFTDVVRNQADRRCLQGCTKVECCGSKFRALAMAAMEPDKPPTMSQEEADERLLVEFLGDNRHKLRNMAKAEREEMLLQARTRELANKHGRHRHAYERRATPPGFWRVDFPSTQEEIQDREKADRYERDLVAQRYQEAMRPGGAYLFRDE